MGTLEVVSLCLIAYHVFVYALLILWFSVPGKCSTKKTGVKNPFRQTLIAAQRSPPSAKSITRHSQPERTKTSSGYGRCFFIQIFSNQKQLQPTNQPARTNPHLHTALQLVLQQPHRHQNPPQNQQSQVPPPESVPHWGVAPDVRPRPRALQYHGPWAYSRTVQPLGVVSALGINVSNRWVGVSRSFNQRVCEKEIFSKKIHLNCTCNRFSMKQMPSDFGIHLLYLHLLPRVSVVWSTNKTKCDCKVSKCNKYTVYNLHFSSPTLYHRICKNHLPFKTIFFDDFVLAIHLLQGYHLLHDDEVIVWEIPGQKGFAKGTLPQ